MRDTALSFTLPALNVRGRVVRLGKVAQEILSMHGYPPAVEQLLGEALVLAALMGSLLKDNEGQLTLQAHAGQVEAGQGENTSAVSLLVADYKAGAVRGYAQHDAEAVRALPYAPQLAHFFTQGHLAITFDQPATKERYQGIVPLDGENLAQALEYYFAQSEQTPTLVRIAVEGECAAGLLLQHLPEGEVGRARLHTDLEHPQWQEAAILGATITAEELCDPALEPERLMWRLFSEASEIRIMHNQSLTRGCRCALEHIRSVIAQFSPQERAEMADAQGMVHVDCAFCAKTFPIEME
jgi:molecular chaperone Hsp33